jgi:hypothetical protein
MRTHYYKIKCPHSTVLEIFPCPVYTQNHFTNLLSVKIPSSYKRESLFCQGDSGPIDGLMLIQVISLKTRHIATREDFILIPKIVEYI